MTPNVFQIGKDSRDEWEADGVQYLLENANAVGKHPMVFDVPTVGSWCIMAIGPKGMRNDEKTVNLLMSNILSIPGADIKIETDFHWDGNQFWVAPIVDENLLRKLQRAPSSKTKEKILRQVGRWIPEDAYVKLWDMAIDGY